MDRYIAARIDLDYFWLLAPVWAALGALLTGLVLRRVDTSRVSYNEARQLLSAMVYALSLRIQKTEVLARHLSEQMEIVRASQTRTIAEESAADKIRLLEYVREWGTNVKHVVQKVDELQANLTRVDTQLQNLRARLDRMRATETSVKVQIADVGMVTEEVIAKLSETERQVLLLLYEGPKSAPEIGKLSGRSREHSARLMKTLFEQGFVERETHRQPYQYTLNEKVRETLSQNAIEASIQSERQT